MVRLDKLLLTTVLLGKRLKMLINETNSSIRWERAADEGDESGKLAVETVLDELMTKLSVVLLMTMLISKFVG